MSASQEENRFERLGRTVRWSLAIGSLLFGIFTLDLDSRRWMALGMGAYAFPLLMQLQRRDGLRAFGIWTGIFLVSQAVLSHYPPDRDLKTLPPNLHRMLDVQDSLPGITGRQSITTDHHGFRVTRRIDYEDDSALRIFAIGASTTAQIYLDDHTTWTHLLQEDLDSALYTEVEVVNAGVSGLRMQHHVATLERAIELGADAVLLVAGVNDWNWQIKQHFQGIEPIDTGAPPRNEWRLKETLLGRVLLRLHAGLETGLQSGLRSDPLPDREEQNVRESAVRVVRSDFRAPLRGSLNLPHSVSYSPREVAPDFATHLKKFSDLCREHDILCVIVPNPTGYRRTISADYRAGMWMTPPYQSYTLTLDSLIDLETLYGDTLERFAAARGHAFCDPRAAMSASYLHFYDDCHLNTAGAAAFAQALSPCVLGAIAKRLD